MAYFLQTQPALLHRSWTGYCVFVAHFKRRQEGFVLALIEANRNRRQYTEQDDAYDAKLVSDIKIIFSLRRKRRWPGGFDRRAQSGFQRKLSGRSQSRQQTFE